MMINVPERYNASVLLDQNLEAGRGEKIAIMSGDERITYRQLFKYVCSLGRALLDLGVRREERVLMLLDDSPAFPIVFYGVIRIGAVAVPVNPLYKVDDYRYFLWDTGARVIVTDSSHLDKVEEALRGTANNVIVVVDDSRGTPEGEKYHSLSALLSEGGDEFDAVSTHRDDMAFWLYSSGSTGRPKGVVHLQHDILYTCETYARHVLEITTEDLCFSTSKCFHAYGLGNSICFPFWAGATAVLVPGRPTAEWALENIQRYRPTLFFSVPTLYNAILLYPKADAYDLSSIRLCISAGEALPAEIWHRWKQMYGLTILDGIGSTEMLHIFISNTRQELKPGSSGKPVPGYRVKLVDESGNPVGRGESGELYVSGDSAAAFYWHQHEKTKQTFYGEWVRTGDRYRLDEDGFFWHEGRADDMIKVGGLWVSPVEVEGVLLTHPAVREVAVVGVSEEGLTRLKAYVVLREGYGPSDKLIDELQNWCKNRLQRYQYPHRVEFVNDLPKTITGKIQRFKLREQG